MGTGTSTVIISLSSFLIPAKWAIVLASFVNIFGGLAMCRIDPVPIDLRYWGPISLSMIAGSVIGALMLKSFPPQTFDLVLGIAFFLTSLWFLFKRSAKPLGNVIPPEKADRNDMALSFFAGICGGFIGINAPPLILYFGRILNKQYLRRLLVIIFIPAAIAQTAVFAWTGLLTREILFLGMLLLPTIGVGVYLGNRVFLSLSEAWFKRIMGLFLMFVSFRLIIKSLM